MEECTGEVGRLKGVTTLRGEWGPSTVVGILTVQERGGGVCVCTVEGNGIGHFVLWTVSALGGV